MKIFPHQILKNAESQKAQKNEKPNEINFANILQKAVDHSTTSKDQSIKLPPIFNISQIQNDPIFSLEGMPLFNRVERILDVFEEYQTKLGDPNVFLKDLSPIINRMEKETKNLLPILDTLPEGDEMKDILNRILIQSTVEILRFNRGDYLHT